ncbi:MAG: hypothetical protein HFJ03_01615 [Lachnospira sp.]|uniref:hypothetical protein n=2 Tax=uncultured Clostridium sp. TaxID=59620 RepID=UPI00216C6527|nr:hypothetical protein [uncultured Clostridium sp.]MCI8426241.1 hypothetical protein [Lachnospira sp.]
MNVTQKISEYISVSKQNINEIIIMVVGNAREITKDFSDFTSGTTVVSEYYALERFNKIVMTFRNEGFEVIPYYDEMDFIHDYLTHRIRNNYYKKIVVFNFAQKGTVHGRKSLVPLFCEMNNIIHTNCDPFTTSFVREKYIWHKLLKGIVPVCDTWVYDSSLGWFDSLPSVGTKVIAKLENQCSSMGIDDNSVFIYNKDKDTYLKKTAEIYSSRLIIQKFIEGYEVEVPFIYDGKSFYSLKPQGISINEQTEIGDKYLDYNSRGNHLFDFYNFDDKFPKVTTKIISAVEKMAKIINIQGMGRIDFRISSDLEYYVTDINSTPHLIEVASPAEALRKIGFKEYASLLHLIIGITLSRHPNQIM